MPGQVRHSRGSKTRAVWERCCLSVDLSTEEFYTHIPDPSLIYQGPHQGLIADIRVSKENGTAKASRILYIGCGNGEVSIQSGRKKYYEDSLGFSRALLVENGQGVKDIRISDVELGEWNIESGQTPYADDAFDSIFILQALYAIKNPVSILKELSRVLKPSGCLILVEPKHLARLTISSKENASEMLSGDKIYSSDEAQLRNKLEHVGFRIDSIVSNPAGESGLIATAVKPRLYFQSGNYKFLSAETGEDLEKVWGLLYQVFCIELGVEPADQSGFLRDKYDEYAMHVLAVDEDNSPVGTIRAVSNNPYGFPMDADFPLSEYMRANGITRGVEGARFAIHEDVPHECRGAIAFGLFKCLFDYCMAMGVNDLFATTTLGMVKKYSMPGFKQIGEPFRYPEPLAQVLWVPIHSDLKEAYKHYLNSLSNQTKSK